MSLPKPYYDDGKGIVIYHGDCREILPLLPKVDLVLTDPPYGINLKYESYDDTLENWFALMRWLIPAIKNKATMSILPCCQIKQLGFFYREFEPDWIISWYKGSPGHAAFVGFNDWEPLLVYGKIKCVSMHDHFQTPTRDDSIVNHPCPKPPEFSKWLISRATDESHLILDPFMGSGTTLRAAKDLGRKAIGIEIEEKYCEISVRRLEQEVLPLQYDEKQNKRIQGELLENI